MELTPAGADLLARAESILAEVERARSDMDGHAGVSRGLVRVAATTGDALRLPRALATFNAEHPGIRIGLRHGSTGEVVELVRKGAADLAVIGTLASDAPGLTSEVVAEEDLCVACAPDDALAGSSEIGFADLRGRGLILAEPDSPLRHAVAAACADAGFSPVPLFEVSDPWTVRFLTATGLGLSVVPRSWLELPGPPIAHVELTGAVPRHRVSLLTPAAGATPAAALLREHLRRRLTAPPPASASAGPDQREHGLAAVEHHERGHRHHAVAGRELLEHRAHHAAGPAPGGREVDHDRPVGLEHFGGELSIGN